MQPHLLLEPNGPALVCAVCNQKGGVGKTTSTCHLARAASLAGLRVLVVDLDPQGNATSALSADELPKTAIGVADVIQPNAEYELRDVLVSTIWEGVTLAPTPNTDALTEAERQIEAMQFGRENAVAKALRPLRDDFDLVLIDNTPALGRLLINALTAAELALIITQPEQWSADGLFELHRTIDLVTEYHNERLRPVGPLINGKRKTEHHDRIVEEAIIPFYDGKAWSADDEIIPMWTSVSDYLHAGIGLDQAKAVKDRRLAEVYGRFIRRLMTEGGRI